MFITISLTIIFLLTIILLLNNRRKKRISWSKIFNIISKNIFDLILKISNENLRKFFLKQFYPESFRYIELTVLLACQYYILKYGDIIQTNLFNNPTIIISNCDFADYVLMDMIGLIFLLNSTNHNSIFSSSFQPTRY